MMTDDIEEAEIIYEIDNDPDNGINLEEMETENSMENSLQIPQTIAELMVAIGRIEEKLSRIEKVEERVTAIEKTVGHLEATKPVRTPFYTYVLTISAIIAIVIGVVNLSNMQAQKASTFTEIEQLKQQKEQNEMLIEELQKQVRLNTND